MRFHLGIIVCACLLLIGGTASLRADEGIRQVQEELRKRNLYFGDIDGQSTEELTGALKRYQKRKGFEVTGTICADTAASLRIQSTIASTDKDPSEWEDLPLEPEPPAEPPPAEPPPLSPVVSQDRVNQFVETYLRNGESNDICHQIWFYAFPVQYFEYGPQNRDFVRRDIKYHVKDWPERKYTLIAPPSFAASENAGETRIEFSIDYYRRDKKRIASGKAKYFWTVRSEGDVLKIASIREELLPNK
ncbi:MAG TPA: peptidoglycan-binding domain-containing protein [Chthoniobacterales bacterium]|nr:peptidoglycan-binding domain-containing protein [Chthoniobacterales bacterium]